MKATFCAGTLMCLLGFAAPLTAQTSTTTGTAATVAIQPLLDALKLRADMVGGIVNGTETADAAVARLKTLALPAGFQGEPDTDYANAAIDVGQRLVVAGKPDQAALFFQAADASLTLVVDRTPDASAAAKAQLLATRAYVRAQFLNRVVQGMADLDEAQQLLPGDAYLQGLRQRLANDKAALLATGPTK